MRPYRLFVVVINASSKCHAIISASDGLTNGSIRTALCGVHGEMWNVRGIVTCRSCARIVRGRARRAEAVDRVKVVSRHVGADTDVPTT